MDQSKQVKLLGKFPLPVEVIPMARSAVARKTDPTRRPANISRSRNNRLRQRNPRRPQPKNPRSRRTRNRNKPNPRRSNRRPLRPPTPRKSNSRHPNNHPHPLTPWERGRLALMGARASRLDEGGTPSFPARTPSPTLLPHTPAPWQNACLFTPAGNPPMPAPTSFAPIKSKKPAYRRA